MDKFKFVVTYKNGTTHTFYTTVPSFPDDALENATSYACYNAQSRKISFNCFGYPDANAREETWYWVMSLPMKEEDLMRLIKDDAPPLWDRS